MGEFFGRTVLKWYGANKRDLPWRNTSDPFKIWLSEIILQQTRVNQGMAYYLKFIDNFKNVHELAEASEDTVLKLWQGLGYYIRARNLHSAAKFVSKELKGVFPDSYDGLIKLKGVGDYTASAIASFSFNERRPVLDGNVFRVLSRFYGVDEPINTTTGVKLFKELSWQTLPKKNVADYNQGIMEFGALQCIPKSPNCSQCPLNSKCEAFAQGKVDVLPVKLKKTKVKELFLDYFILIAQRKTLIYQRNKKGIWQNLYEFPSRVDEGKMKNETEEILKVYPSLASSELKKVHQSVEFLHLLSHRRLKATFHVYHLEELPKSKEFVEVELSDLHDYPIHRLMEKFLESYLF